MKMLALGLACLATSGHAACVTQRVADIPLTVWQNKLLLTVGINGSPETMALDTGAGISVISAEAAGRLNILHDFDHAAQVGGVGGADSALFIGQVDALSVGGAQFAKLSLPIVAFPERDWQNHPLAGLLGADILANFAVDVDIAGGHLALWRETGCDNEPPPWDDNATPIAIELDPSNHIQVPLKVDGVTLNALLDTGAGGFVLTQRAGMRAGVTDDALDSDPEIHGTGVNNRPWSGHLHRFHDVRFGQARFTNVMAALMPSRNIAQYDALIGADALVGMTLLSGTRIWISYHTKSLYVFPAPIPQPE
jgi:predicted aspartyl protease